MRACIQSIIQSTLKRNDKGRSFAWSVQLDVMSGEKTNKNCVECRIIMKLMVGDVRRRRNILRWKQSSGNYPSVFIWLHESKWWISKFIYPNFWNSEKTRWEYFYPEEMRYSIAHIHLPDSAQTWNQYYGLAYAYLCFHQDKETLSLVRFFFVMNAITKKIYYYYYN